LRYYTFFTGRIMPAMERDITADALGPLPFPSFWTVSEVARLLQSDEAEVKQMFRRGGLPAYFVGGQWLISTADLIRWLIVQRKTGGERNGPTRRRK